MGKHVGRCVAFLVRLLREPQLLVTELGNPWLVVRQVHGWDKVSKHSARRVAQLQRLGEVAKLAVSLKKRMATESIPFYEGALPYFSSATYSSRPQVRQKLGFDMRMFDCTFTGTS